MPVAVILVLHQLYTEKKKATVVAFNFTLFVVFSNPDFQGVPDKNGFIFYRITNIMLNWNIQINNGAADIPVA